MNFFARWVLNIGYLLHKYFINRVVKAIKVMEKYLRIYLRHKMLLKQEKIPSPIPLNHIEGNFRFRKNTQVRNSVNNSEGKYFSFFIFFLFLVWVFFIRENIKIIRGNLWIHSKTLWNLLINLIGLLGHPDLRSAKKFCSLISALSNSQTNTQLTLQSPNHGPNIAL